MTVSAKDDESTATSANASATVNYTNVAPAINIVKSVSPSSIPEGTTGPVTYTYTVTNTSSAGAFDPLTINSLVDDNGTSGTADDFTPAFIGGDTDNDNRLDAGETWTYKKVNHSVPAKNAGQTHINKVTVSASDAESTATSDNASATVTYLDVAPVLVCIDAVHADGLIFQLLS